MNGALHCEAFEALAVAYVDGTLEGARRDAASVHLGGCARCRALVAVLGLRPTVPLVPPGGSIVSPVLSATVPTGAACARAEKALPAFLDGELTGLDSELVASHVAHCAACRAMAETLSWVGPVLSELGTMAPGGGFARAVVAATAAAHGRSFRRAVRDAWHRWTMRPAAALEGAYAGAVVVTLLFGMPTAPLRALPPRALTETGPVVERIVADASVGGVVVGAAEGVARGAVAGATFVSKRFTGARAAADDALDHGVEAGRAAFRGDVLQTGVKLGEVGGDLKRLMRAVWSGVAASDPEETDDDGDE